jgi:hypothetical protein
VATTAAGTTLTAQHRLDQLRLRTATVRDLLRVFAQFDPNDISTTWASIEPAIVALIQARQPLSASLAGMYLQAFRDVEQITGNASIALAPTLTSDELIPNLRILGPGNAWRLNELARPTSEIARTTLVNIEGEVTRQILNGGRKTIVDTTNNDPKARGYIRVTDGAPCAFCAMLAGRGPVYRSESSAVTGKVYSDRVDGFRAHRKCGCTAEPVYFTDSPWPSSATKWKDLYAETAKAVPKDAPDWSSEVRREFRRRYEAATT